MKIRITPAERSLFSWSCFFASIIFLLYSNTAFTQQKDGAAVPISPTQVAGQEKAKKEPVIDEIEIQGLDKVSYQTVINKLQTKKGEVFSNKLLEEDIRHLYESDLFLSINWKTENIPTTGKIKIILTVKESTIVEDVKFEGAKGISASTLKEGLKTAPGTFLNESVLKADTQTITDKYLEKGYFFVVVNYRIDSGAKDKILTFVIREGPEVKIEDVIFVGNKSFPLKSWWLFWEKSVLHDQMKQSSGYFKEKDLVLDIERIKNYYRNRGWLDVNVFIESTTFNETKNRILITIHIDEGESYKLSKVIVTGNTLIDTATINAKQKLKAGDKYDMELISQDINSIKTLYGKLGYIDCNVDIKQYVPKSPALIELTYQITEGKPSYLEKIKITGNDKTKDKVIRREMLIHPGDLMDYGKIRDSLDHIANTRYFKDLNYEIQDGSLPDHKNLVVKVVETTTGMMNFGGGYSSNNGLTGIVELDQTNFDLGNPPKSFSGFFSGKSFAGGGQQLRLVWQPGITTSESLIDFTEPYLFNKPIELNVNIFDYSREWTDYNEGRSGGGFTLAHRFWEKWKIGIGPATELIKISSVDSSSAPAEIQDLSGQHRLQSITTFIDHDTRDRPFIPHSGYHWKASEEFAGGFMSGDYNFAKVLLTGETYHCLKTFRDEKKLMLNLSAKFGKEEELRNTQIPFFEKFYAGGFGSIRGFQFQTVSPKINGDSVGGKIMSVFNSEITYPLYSEEMAGQQMEILRIAGFYDAANVADDWSNLRWNTYRSSIGFGFRIQLGMIPVSFDIAYPIKKQDTDDTQRLQFNLGYGF